MAEIAELIERLEKATGPNRNIDAAIAIWALETGMGINHANGHPKPYTASIDAALTLVPEGAEIELTNLHAIARAAVGLNCDMPEFGEHAGGSLALALCIAALKARAALTTAENRGGGNGG